MLGKWPKVAMVFFFAFPFYVLFTSAIVTEFRTTESSLNLSWGRFGPDERTCSGCGKKALLWFVRDMSIVPREL